MSTVGNLSARFRALWSKLLRVPNRSDLSDDLAAEIESNLDLKTADNIARGMSPSEAREDARRHFGNPTLVREQASEAWGFPRLETFFQDLRYGARAIGRAPSFFLMVILTLALGIGANTALFSVVDAVLLKPLPYPHSERLVMLGESTKKTEGFSVTWGNYGAWRKYNHSFEEMAARETAHFTVTGLAEPVFTSAGVVTSEFFDLVGAKPVLGRTFTDDEDRFGSEPTVVVDYGFWSARLGSNPNVVGSTLALDGRAFRVVGVLAPGLRYFGRPMDFYVPMGIYRRDAAPRGQHGSIRVLARLRPGVTWSAARGDLDEIMQRLAQADPGSENEHHSYVGLLAEENKQPVRATLWLLMGAVGLVLLIACANVASLMLARGSSRSREMAIRTAIGAGRTRLARQLLTENLLVASIGGVCGILLARWCLRAVIAAAPRGIPRIDSAALDWRVMLFATALILFTGVLVGLAPVLTAGKIDLADALTGGRSETGTRRDQRFRNTMVVAEITIALVLAFSSGVLLRSLITAQSRNPGFEPGHVVALELVLPSAAYKSGEAIQNFYDSLETGLRALPGAAEVAKVNCPPGAGDCGDWFYSVLGKPAPARGDVPVALFNFASPGYFAALRVPMRQGREFTDTDRKGGPRVAIVNETLARQWWPNESAVGHQIKSGGPYMEGPLYEIVGVAGDVSQEGLDKQALPEVFQPFAQSPVSAMVVMIRTSVDPASLSPAVRRTVLSVDKNLAIQSLRPLENSVAETLNRRRFGTLLLAAFAGLALLLSGIGTYGLLNYWVAARQREIAIRLALGASPSTILNWAGWQASKLIVTGVVLGIAGAWAASHWLESLVFGVSPRDSGMMTAAVLAVVVAAALAAALPLSRAMQVNAASKLQA